MATEKKNEKERSVKERLEALYKLQSLLSEIDRIRILRGELPNEVKDLEDEIVRFQTRIGKYQDEIADLKKVIQEKTGDIETRKIKIAKYEQQINEVRNNREFAFLDKEREYETLEVELAEKKIREAEEKIRLKEEEIKAAQDELSDNQSILDEKKNELSEIVSETRQEEEAIMLKTKEIEPLIDDYTLKAFKRIRSNARNGLGIVSVERDACGGCFNRIPPQRQLEIKMHKKIIVCEYCGRILIDPTLAGIEEKPKEAPAKPKRVRKAPAKPAAADEAPAAPAPEA
ncbi:MAG: hypothetical protein J1F07_02650 [Muribaculaceae bacterium]|nr:hypothetical protein [Muribaculaceae bacterium]